MLELGNISHAYGDVASLHGVSLQVEPGEIVCLLGPSGCGKTTLLRVIAGLEADYTGTITFEGEDIRAVPVHQRNFGLMFQDFALFPHLTVRGNIAYGLKRRGLGRGDIDRRVAELVDRIGLAGLEQRDVAALSGGQKQRVALARSLAPNPRLLMLDEPLGSLDAQLRDELALELRRIIKGQRLSALYVTHDHREAYAVGDRIAVMSTGRLEQYDRPPALYNSPKTAFVARFLGLRNIFPANRNKFTRELAAARALKPAKGDLFFIHPGGIKLNAAQTAGAIHCRGVLLSAVFRGDRYDVNIRLDEDMRLHFPVADLTATAGEAVTIAIALDAITPLQL